MRWHRLFADLEAQLADADRAELAAEVADRTRRETALIRLVDRLVATGRRPVAVSLRGAGTVSGVVLEAAPEWLLIEDVAGAEVLVAMAAVLTVTGTAVRTGVPGAEGEVGRRLGLAAALRGLARDRAPLTATLVDGTGLSGTIDRVGADHLELAEHPAGEPRRAAALTGVQIVAVSALASLRAAR